MWSHIIYCWPHLFLKPKFPCRSFHIKLIVVFNFSFSPIFIKYNMEVEINETNSCQVSILYRTVIMASEILKLGSSNPTFILSVSPIKQNETFYLIWSSLIGKHANFNFYLFAQIFFHRCLIIFIERHIWKGNYKHMYNYKYKKKKKSFLSQHILVILVA